jgi:hypothetical protein
MPKKEDPKARPITAKVLNKKFRGHLFPPINHKAKPRKFFPQYKPIG